VAAIPQADSDQQSVAFVELSQKFFLKDVNKIFDCALTGCEKIRKILDDLIRSSAYEMANIELTQN
jgi:hypothetical protein